MPEAAVLDLAGHDYSNPSKPRIAWDDSEARERLITALVTDALIVLEAAAGLELNGEAADAVGLLALVAGQDVEPGDGDGSWRIARKTAPDRVISTVDPESRTATCPAGHTVKVTPGNSAIFKRHCQGCPLRDRCTARDGRELNLHIHDAELAEARRAWRDGEFADD